MDTHGKFGDEPRPDAARRAGRWPGEAIPGGDGVEAVRGELDYVDQVPRKLAYERAHPDAVINYRRTHWQAIVPYANGETVLTRLSLKAPMNALDKLSDPAAEDSSTSQP
jgi:hypothetical protein